MSSVYSLFEYLPLLIYYPDNKSTAELVTTQRQGGLNELCHIN